MRKETTKEYIVRTTTTGYIEADMLGHTLNVAEEMKDKQNTSQRPHRKKEKTVSELLQEGFEYEQSLYDQKWYQTAPTACLRSIKVLISKGKSIGLSVRGRVRKLFVNS